MHGQTRDERGRHGFEEFSTSHARRDAPAALLSVYRRLRVDEVSDKMGDLLQREIAARTEPWHVRARKVEPRVVDFLVGLLDDGFAVAVAFRIADETGSEIARVHLFRIHRVAVRAERAVLT